MSARYAASCFLSLLFLLPSLPFPDHGAAVAAAADLPQVAVLPNQPLRRFTGLSYDRVPKQSSNASPVASAGSTAVQISPKAIVSDACASYATLDRLNRRVNPAVLDLTSSTDFFSHYRLNLFHKKCPFWDEENGLCGNVACAVTTLDNEEDIPLVWRSSELGKLEGPRASHPNARARQERAPDKPLAGSLGEDVGESCVVEYDDECDERDYCVPEDESATSKGDYVSLIQNPERFTGYAGAGAAQVWDAIYRENCFQRSSFPHSAQLGMSPLPPRGPAAHDFKAVIDAAGRIDQLRRQREAVEPLTPFVARTGLEATDDECLEKRVFYRVISGMHASISTHLCWDFLNQTTGEWMPNHACYAGRLRNHPERISNLYFNYALVTRAVAKLGPHIAGSGANGGGYTFCSGDASQDAATRAKVLAVTEAAASVPQIFDESLMFKNGEGPSLKEDFRNRFRNVSRVMDCVGCDKCRLWGKLQTAGYGAALKILFEFDNLPRKEGANGVAGTNGHEVLPPLKRTELVALFNTYARVSSSLRAIAAFRMMDEEAAAAEEGNGASVAAAAPSGSSAESPAIPDRAKKPHTVVVDKSGEPASPHLNGGDSTATPKAQEPELDEGEAEEAEEKPPRRRPVTAKEEFLSELDNVVNAYRTVMGLYIKLPRTL